MEDTRQQNIEDARAMLDLIEANPDIPFNGVWSAHYFYSSSDKETFLSIARSLGTFTKNVDMNGKLMIARKFGLSRILAEIPQSIVCRPVEVVKKVTEYQCDPLLSPTENEEIEAMAA